MFYDVCWSITAVVSFFSRGGTAFNATHGAICAEDLPTYVPLAFSPAFTLFILDCVAFVGGAVDILAPLPLDSGISPDGVGLGVVVGPVGLAPLGLDSGIPPDVTVGLGVVVGPVGLAPPTGVDVGLGVVVIAVVLGIGVAVGLGLSASCLFAGIVLFLGKDFLTFIIFPRTSFKSIPLCFAS